MEFFPAGSLKMRVMRKEQDFLRQHGQDILKQWATGLAFMNAKGWVHRDVKPDNILVNSAAEAKIIDFAIAQRPPTGLARLFYKKGKAQGTPSYMSPEQIRSQILDERADIYSFGCSAYELVANRPPFRGADTHQLLQKHIAEKPYTPKQYNPDVTDQFADLVLRMLAKKREDRPKGFHEILMALRTMRVFKTDEKK
jgi:serine/threonine-protein kinase